MPLLKLIIFDKVSVKWHDFAQAAALWQQFSVLHLYQESMLAAGEATATMPPCHRRHGHITLQFFTSINLSEMVDSNPLAHDTDVPSLQDGVVKMSGTNI